MNLKPLRYIVKNPGQEIFASYNCGLGTSLALRWAKDNARQHNGEVFCEYVDGSIELKTTYAAKT